MVAMYGIIIGDWYESQECAILTENVNGMMLSKIDNVQDIESQLNNDVYVYINNYVIDTSNFMPSGKVEGAMLMSDKVVLIVDSEIAQGAVLKIEYKMPIRARAIYGSGNISELTITDTKDPNLSFSKDEKLITDPSKTNASYGWDMNENGEIVTHKEMPEANLVLSVLLSANQLQEAVYGNSAVCKIRFEAGKDEDGRPRFASYTRYSKAMDVTVLPPFGDDKKEINVVLYSLVISILFGTVVILIIKLRKKFKRRTS